MAKTEKRVPLLWKSHWLSCSSEALLGNWVPSVPFEEDNITEFQAIHLQRPKTNIFLNFDYLNQGKKMFINRH